MESYTILENRSLPITIYLPSTFTLLHPKFGGKDRKVAIGFSVKMSNFRNLTIINHKKIILAKLNSII
jgi:hypothetical protein